MTITSVEEAYSYLAKAMINASDMHSWTNLILKVQAYSDMVSSEFLIVMDENVDETKYVKSVSEAVLFLRNNLLATTGQRIWGLTFTLYPDGKFNIEYDYNKFEDYQETDEAITGEEINQSLTNLSN